MVYNDHMNIIRLIESFVERHKIAFATPPMILLFLMYRAEAGYRADFYSMLVTIMFFLMAFWYVGLIMDRFAPYSPDDQDDQDDTEDWTVQHDKELRYF